MVRARTDFFQPFTAESSRQAEENNREAEDPAQRGQLPVIRGRAIDTYQFG